MAFKKILISCGELSGEIHSSNLVKEIRKISKNTRFFAVGSVLLKKTGCKIIVDYREISIMGFTEVIKKYFYIRKRIRFVKDFIKRESPDAVILVDFPGFNFIIAEYAKKLNIRIIYYIPPQIWAWHYSRVKKIRKFADLVIPILPFEKDIYTRENIPCKYFGHPVVDNIRFSFSKKEYYKKHRIPSNKKIIALLPGSRPQEIEHHIDHLLKTASKLEEKYSDLVFIINVADTVDLKMIKERISKYAIKQMRVVQKENYDLFNNAFAAICVSGTVTLETAFFKVPMTVIYQVDALFYFIVKHFLIKVPFISLVNLIAGKPVLKEIVQKELTSENLLKEADRLIADDKYRKKMITSLEQVKKKLGKKGIVQSIAREVNSLLSCD
ncbi:MAG: lipid-A-disaccharide synthase [Spirochaetes bacterium]|nr:lipid-A-disaccharide synthase [Spirochaetota bacterium]